MTILSRSNLRLLILAMMWHASLLLTACSTALATRTAAESAADDSIARQLKEALSRDQRIYDAHIEVTSDRGVVRLYGVIAEAEDFAEARRVAWSVPGVKKVISELRLVDRR
jgi:osmotically-inducible protein OsmY